MYTPPFTITPKILLISGSIQETIGELRSYELTKPSVKLRKQNKIKTIHHSLAIEGNTLSEEKITALVDGKRVLGPERQIREVQNAISLYEKLATFDPLKEKDFLKAHKQLLQGLISSAGQYRSTSVGVFKGRKISHIAPPARQVPGLMHRLFDFLKNKGQVSFLIKACVFHYELEFIHPFLDGNGRMGRLWQQLILMRHSPIFEFISVETLIHKRQTQYYNALEKSDKAGDSTAFIEFSLEVIQKSLVEFQSALQPARPKTSDRIAMAHERFGQTSFSRKDYLQLHKGLSTATASRDLAKAVEDKTLIRKGDKAKAKYSFA